MAEIQVKTKAEERAERRERVLRFCRERPDGVTAKQVAEEVLRMDSRPRATGRGLARNDLEAMTTEGLLAREVVEGEYGRRTYLYVPSKTPAAAVDPDRPYTKDDLTAGMVALLGKADNDGRVWVVPAQLVMTRRLEAMGVLYLTETRRPNKWRGAVERKCIVREEYSDLAVACRPR